MKSATVNSPPWQRRGGRDINKKSRSLRVDFYCPQCRLIIELDGQPHYEIIGDTYEAERTKYLERLGIKIVRFENRLIYEALEAVLETIRQELYRRGA